MHSLCGGPAFSWGEGSGSTGEGVRLGLASRGSSGRGAGVGASVGAGLWTGGRSKSVPKIALPSCSSLTGAAVVLEFMLLDPACERNKGSIVVFTVRVAVKEKRCSRVDDKVQNNKGQAAVQALSEWKAAIRVKLGVFRERTSLTLTATVCSSGEMTTGSLAGRFGLIVTRADWPRETVESLHAKTCQVSLTAFQKRANALCRPRAVQR